MACSNPLDGWLGHNGQMVFSKKKSNTGVPMQVPCGQCWSCRLARSREWATRLVKEALYWPEKECSFITLTYNDENLPPNHGLVLEHYQEFMKSLRYENSKIIDGKRVFKKIKFFHCGEYGKTCQNCGLSYPQHSESKSNQKHNGCNTWMEGLGRPHYHAILFGVAFKDMEFFKKTKAGEEIYRSKTLDKLWKKGFCSIGKVSFQSCAYVARYVMKKVNHSNTKSSQEYKDHYTKTVINKETGEVTREQVKPEYITMSRNPGIGNQYVLDNLVDIFKNDGVLINRKGKATLVRPPRYFTKILEQEDPKWLEKIKDQRKQKRLQNKEEYTLERATIKERVKQIKMREVTRDYEEFHDES